MRSTALQTKAVLTRSILLSSVVPSRAVPLVANRDTFSALLLLPRGECSVVVVWRHPRSWSAESVESGQSHPRFLVLCLVVRFSSSWTFFAAFHPCNVVLEVVALPGYVFFSFCEFIEIVIAPSCWASLAVPSLAQSHLDSISQPFSSIFLLSGVFQFSCVSTKFLSLNICIFAPISWVLLFQLDANRLRCQFRKKNHCPDHGHRS